MGKIVWMEGFGKYGGSFSSGGVGDGRWVSVTTSAGVISTEFGSGAKAIRMGTATDVAAAVFSSGTGSTFYFGVRLQVPTIPGPTHARTLYHLKSSAGASVGSVGVEPGGLIGYYAKNFASGAQLIAQNNTALTINSEFHLGVKVLLSTTTAGTVNFEFNGSTDGGGTGQTIDTATGSPVGVKQFRIMNSGAGDPNGEATGIPNTLYGDFVVTNSSAIGDATITYYAPVTDSTAAAGWTPSSGSTHASLLDETPADDDTTYVSASSGTPTDRFTMATVSTGVSYIAVQSVAWARKESAGIGQLKFQNVLSTSSTTTAPIALGTGYQYVAKVSETNAAGNAWTRTGVNNTEWGFQRSSA